MTRLRVGVAGCGAVAQIMHLPLLAELDQEIELAAIAEIAEDTRRLVGDLYRVTRRYATLAEMLAAGDDLDAVLILTPGSHGAAVVAAARAGKHVFVEKPLAYTLRECDDIAEAVQRAGIVLQVGYMKRYDPAYRRALEQIRALKDLRYVQITTIHPASELFFAHQPIRRRSDQPWTHPYPAGPFPIGEHDPVNADGEERRLLREGIGLGVSTEMLGAFKVMLTSLCHDINALRGLIGEPTDLLSCEVWQRGGCVSTLLGFGPDVRCHYAFAYVPDLRDYREELAFYAGGERVRLVFPSPFLRNMPTELFLQRSDDGAAAETRLIVSYEEAFKEELRAFAANVRSGARPLTDVADSRADIALLTAMARRAATPAP